MELIYFKKDFSKKMDKCVIALGMFDGIHLAHMKIINELLKISSEKKVKSAIITFYPHPDFVLGKNKDTGYITPLEEKISIFEKIGLDYLVIIDFNKDFANLSFKEFESVFLDKINIETIVVGYDYTYGKNGLGNTETLTRKYNIKVIEEIKVDNIKIGTKLIKEYLQNGDISKVNEILGRNFTIEGIVTSGDKVGRTIGIRTANIEIDDEYCQIKKGVYNVIVTIDKIKYQGVCNIGNNPTLNFVYKPRLEVHIIDFSADIYNKKIIIEFIEFTREEIKYNQKEELINQINKDIEYAKKRIKL